MHPLWGVGGEGGWCTTTQGILLLSERQTRALLLYFTTIPTPTIVFK
jgi:hypothetical protein